MGSAMLGRGSLRSRKSFTGSGGTQHEVAEEKKRQAKTAREQCQADEEQKRSRLLNTTALQQQPEQPDEGSARRQ